eukprot:TRINITY_DN2332_c1_g1_i6.p1 TRINITY_DN2332_c1_g1~~TRINITY_DN2332_c1_g1_i6.p1  ORF type:complete len:517 (-),score=90.88 TRINITY_DN2332_c1_g1_i6:180-1730(-)
MRKQNSKTTQESGHLSDSKSHQISIMMCSITNKQFKFNSHSPPKNYFKVPKRIQQQRVQFKTLICQSTAVQTQDGRVSSADIKDGSKQLIDELIDLNPPKGTRDFPPDEMRQRQWLFSHFAHVSELFGFERFDAPVLESESLFVRKAGEEIVDQLYSFEDRGGRRVALRPELTPSLARLILQKGKGLALPAKWYAVGQCWRYERMTRGRRREHYQWNMDIIGIEGMEAEAEILSAIVQFFQQVGLTSQDVGIKISSRKVLQEVLSQQGVPAENFGSVCVIVDKLDKLPKDKIVEQLRQIGLSDATIQGTLDALQIESVSDLESLLGTESQAVKDLKYLFQLSEGYGYQDWLKLDASVVRGLAYYTGTVFEAFDREGKLRAICGGGRYDQLLGTFGGEDKPCVGFGFGDAVIVELLKDKNLLPDTKNKVDDMVMAMDERLRGEACNVAATLRGSGRKVDLVLEPKKMKWAFKQAERINAKRLILIGVDEWEKGCVRVKNLETREEEDVILDQLFSQM